MAPDDRHIVAYTTPRTKVMPGCLSHRKDFPRFRRARWTLVDAVELCSLTKRGLASDALVGPLKERP